MKILWLKANRKDRVAFHLFDTLQKYTSRIADIRFVERTLDEHPWHFTKNVTEGKKQLNSLLKDIDISQYDVIFTDSLFAFYDEPWESIKIPKIVLFEDMHGPMVRKMIHDAVNKFKFDHIFVRYLEAWYDIHGNEFCDVYPIWLPHAIDTDIFFNHGHKKFIDVLSTGRLDPTVYPKRTNTFHTLNSGSEYQISRIERPDETDKEKWPIGEDYAKLLNESKVCIACTSKFKYPVLKLFEVPASYSILYCDETKDMNKLGFYPDETFVKITNDPVKQIRTLLSDRNYARYAKILNHGHSLIHEKHTGEIRAKEFIKKLEDII